MCVPLQNLKHHYQLLLEEKSRIKGERDFCRTDYDKYRSLYENVRKENRHLQDKNTQLIKDVEQCRLQLHQVSVNTSGQALSVTNPGSWGSPTRV